jgi:SAM-dependent methyltransferase
VVDLGCGTGLIARSMTEAGFAVTGVDLDASMLRRARRTGRLARMIRADAACTGLDARSADAVVAVNVVHVHPDPAALLAEARRLAAPEAMIVLVWPAATATHERLNAVDRALGRSRVSVLLADAARGAIGRAAWLTGVRRRPDRIVLNEIEDAIDILGLVVVERLELYRCQRMLVLRVGGHAKHGELSPSTASPQLP